MKKPDERDERPYKSKSAYQKGGDMSGLFWGILALGLIAALVERLMGLL